MSPVRERPSVVVAEGQPLYRTAMVDAIRRRPDLEFVGEVADGRSALELIARLHPSVAVVESALPELDGHRVLNAIVRDELPTRVVFLSPGADAAADYRALASGASACLTKRVDAAGLCDAIATVARGDVVIAEEAHAGIAEEIRLRAVDGRPVLTERERQILQLVAKGLSAPSIGQEIYLGTATVKTHLAHVYSKLGVSDRAAAVAEAMRRGLLE